MKTPKFRQVLARLLQALLRVSSHLQLPTQKQLVPFEMPWDIFHSL